MCPLAGPTRGGGSLQLAGAACVGKTSSSFGCSVRSCVH